MSNKLNLDIRGDTIVEVLISIVILALVLSGAYRTADASLANVTDAQERTQALYVAQNQAEDLRANASLTSFTPYTALNKQFCFSSSNVATGYDPAESTTTGVCVMQGRYTVIITTTAAPGPATAVSPSVNVGSYKINIIWPAVNTTSGGNNNLVIFYRVAT